MVVQDGRRKDGVDGWSWGGNLLRVEDTIRIPSNGGAWRVANCYGSE